MVHNEMALHSEVLDVHNVPLVVHDEVQMVHNEMVLHSGALGVHNVPLVVHDEI